MKKYRHQFAKDPNIDLTKVRAASLTSDAEAAIICPVSHTHTCMHVWTHKHGEAHLLDLVTFALVKDAHMLMHRSHCTGIAYMLRECAYRQAARTIAEPCMAHSA